MTIIANQPVWRAELTIGTRAGYSGPEIVTPGDLVPLVQAFQATDRPWYATIVWARGTVLGPTFPPETVIKLTLESNPLYSAGATEQDVAAYAVDLATYLAERLAQVRVYCAVYPIRGLIVETAASPHPEVVA